jgi:hypothetical protein
MKRLLTILVVLVLAIIAYLSFPPAEHVWNISNPTGIQERRFTDWFHSFSSGLLAIRIVGDLSEPALLETPLGSIDLPSGRFDIIAFAHEAWLSSARLRYKSTEKNKGEFKIIVCLGSCPTWINHAPASALPTLYTGGWTAYHGGTEKKAWSGGFHNGKKWGDFIYWDEAGRIIKKERWENGIKQNG